VTRTSVARTVAAASRWNRVIGLLEHPGACGMWAVGRPGAILSRQGPTIARAPDRAPRSLSGTIPTAALSDAMGYPRVMKSRVTATLIAAALIVGACASPAATPGPSPATPGPSPVEGACAAAPDPGQVSGWGQPTTAPTVIPILINPPGELTCGADRILFSFLDIQNRPIGAPDRSASVALYNLGRDASTPAATADGTFVWAIEGSVGIYVANVTLPEAGTWGAEFSTTGPDGKSETIRLTFSVVTDSPVIRVGEAAPPSRTATGDPAGISTDTNPDPRFYSTSVDTALADHKPFVLVFATPKFCTSGQCGPTLERVKPFLDEYPGVTFINVEPYELEADANGQLKAVVTGNQLIPTQPTLDWGLLSEPWVFVVDGSGTVTASFSLIFGDEELRAALDAL